MVCQHLMCADGLRKLGAVWTRWVRFVATRDTQLFSAGLPYPSWALQVMHEVTLCVHLGIHRISLSTSSLLSTSTAGQVAVHALLARSLVQTARVLLQLAVASQCCVVDVDSVTAYPPQEIDDLMRLCLICSVANTRPLLPAGSSMRND